uniref:Uncharacterized protein n=1 Tax=Tetraselmis sp. GSL018 TaxID=582737 RepID=A0A061RP38_9CHLO|eukprot:CAMPEP_0177622120 /NCGR_PEP_ID=MMETSP0419_2-20121207/28040_1 /TAXON_ID=582737 /ORGANISM="Tetraselmis sp., Strain GSL018" /LENGTH=127 /DNA_ID=CAMNT_0019122265 /DNA_START=117 /DNA_END=500 /DNA_ORIENTATION=-
MGGKPSRPPEVPGAPTGFETCVKGKTKPQTEPPAGWYWREDTYFTCPGLLCPCFCENHQWVLAPAATAQPAYHSGGVAHRAPDNTLYFTAAVDQHAYNGPTYGNAAAPTMQQAAAGMPAEPKAIPTV